MNVKFLNKALYKLLYISFGFIIGLSFIAAIIGNDELLKLAVDNIDTVVSLIILLCAINNTFISKENRIFNEKHVYIIAALVQLFSICFSKVPGAFDVNNNCAIVCYALLVYIKSNIIKY